ncbi:MAG: class I SAM-dependent methyltransferase [Candidatus Dojkabacteria bacterium]
MTQIEYQDLYKQVNKGWNDSVSIYKSIVSKLVTSETVIMEAGCGFSNLYTEEYKRAKHVIGVDISDEYLRMNDLIKEKIVSDLSSIPMIKDNSVDLIISSWVFEHLENPDKVIKEFGRVLKPGGRAVFLTPNALNYVVIINKIIPHKFRLWVATKLGGKLTVEPMKTFYRANTVGTLKRMAKDAGLNADETILNGDPTYIAINKFFFYIGVIIETIISLPLINKTKVHIIGVLRKD